MASDPATMPSDPAKAQRAMFCSRRAGAESISAACDRLTNAPDDGLNSASASSKNAKL